MYKRQLLKLVKKGFSRDAAYRMVQRHALKAAKSGGDLKKELLGDPKLKRYLSRRELEEIWNLNHYLKNVDFIFQRVFEGS